MSLGHYVSAAIAARTATLMGAHCALALHTDPLRFLLRCYLPSCLWSSVMVLSDLYYAWQETLTTTSSARYHRSSASANLLVSAW